MGNKHRLEREVNELRRRYPGLPQGRPRSRVRQLLHPLPFLNPRPRQYLHGRVWHDADLDKISIIEYLYRKKDLAGDLVNRVVDGHFLERQGTEVESGRDAGVAADPQ